LIWDLGWGEEVTGCEVTFLNWEKYQGETKRYKHSYWFRTENKIWMHELWDRLSDREFRAFTFLKCYVSQQGHETGSATLELKTISRMSGIEPEIFISTIGKLRELEIVETKGEINSPRDIPVRAPCDSSATQHNITEHNNTDLSEGRISDEIRPAEICEKVIPVKTELPARAKRGRPKSNPDGERRFVGEYVQAYSARWKTRPALDGKTLGEIRRLVRDFGVERASALMQAYLQIDDPRFVKECHPFNLLMLNLNRLSVALDRGIEKPHEGDGWEKFWARVDTGGTSDARSISGAVNAIARPVG